jgi:hypothetical protein
MTDTEGWHGQGHQHAKGKCRVMQEVPPVNVVAPRGADEGDTDLRTNHSGVEPSWFNDP